MNSTPDLHTVMRLKGLMLVWLGLLAAGCETAPLVTEPNPNADLSQYHTFSLLPFPETASAPDPARAQALARAASEAAVAALIEKGYTEVPAKESDLSVGLRGQSLPKIPPTTMAGHTVQTGRAKVMVYDPAYADSPGYDERTLRVEMFDSRTREIVWAGWTRKLSTAPPRPEEVQKAVRRILSKFPSSTLPAAKQP